MAHDDPTRRFSSRVADYVKYRPSYPQALVDHLIARGALAPGAQVADIGSGTGLLTALFLERGFRVVGVEPNADMRAAGDECLRDYAARGLFRSLGARAEATTLPPASIDLLTAGQAFHWFDRPACKSEFRRILRPPAWVALIWNERLVNSPFLEAYENLLRQFALDYSKVDHRQMNDAVIAEFFAPASFELTTFPHSQQFDAAGIQGRLLSSSYAPGRDHPRCAPMLAALDEIYARHQQNGTVAFAYETKMYLGKLLA